MTLQSENHRFVVTSGGGPGIMEAANRGAREGGGKTIGLNIRLPFEQGANPYITDGLHFEFHYFFMRKFWFAYLAKALVVFPGGFGTLDELFEILTLVQTDKLSKKIGVVLYGREYWEQVLDFKPMAEWGAIAEKDLELLHYADTPADGVRALRDHLIAHHLEPATDAGSRRAGHRQDAGDRRQCSVGMPAATDGQCTAAVGELLERSTAYDGQSRTVLTHDRVTDNDGSKTARRTDRSVQGRLSRGRRGGGGATDEELDAHPAPGKWSAREIVHHLADSEMTSAIRLRLLIATDSPAISGYDQEQFARRLYYDRPIAARSTRSRRRG